MTARIEDYAIVGDCRSAALISKGGSLDWLCWPRFDSPSIFAAILDEERGGRFLIAPAEGFRAERAYQRGTNVLVTRFVTPGAELELTDFMPVLENRDAARTLRPEHELLRILRCVKGEAEIEVRFEPRPCYGMKPYRLEELGKLGLRVRIPREGLLTLRTDAPLGPSGRARFRLGTGQVVQFSLAFTVLAPAVLPTLGDRCWTALHQTLSLWRRWSDQTRYDGPFPEAVARSALVLKLLQYAPSGALVAAPTTSLPERPGGDLNWDYRFCWLRDAALTTRALYGLGHHAEAENFITWLLHATNLSLPRLHVLYDLFGRQPRGERELAHLSGHGGARPVRVGNGAMGQVQLDTYGEVIEAAAYFVERAGGQVDGAVARMLIGFGREVARDWGEPDDGIWEIRGGGRHFTHSRALCWTALQRLLEMQEKGWLPRKSAEQFREARDRIRDQVETLGWSEQLQSYTRTLSGADVDASLLLLPWYGYCPAGSPRMLGTWRRIQQDLGLGDGLFKRYRGQLTEGEGGFGICSFWAAEFLALGGGTAAQAQEQFRRMLGYANDVGLYAEEIQPGDGRALGNFPQAYTHVGLINAALSLTRRREAGRPMDRKELVAEEARA